MSMLTAPNIDPELLRAFQLIAEGHSFTQAAEQLGRTQSAVSMQIKRLEDILGQSVLSRGKGGGIMLTPHGRYLLGRVRLILALNDEVVATFRAPAISGVVRLGTPDDYALSHIPGVLRRFAETHPAVQVDVLCSSSTDLVAKLTAGELDLTLVSDGNQPRNWPSVSLWRGPLSWITSTRYAPHRQSPLPLAMAHEECGWRASAQDALNDAGIRYRIAYLSGTQVGTHAPVLAGLAVTVSALTVLPEGVRAMRPEEGLPKLPEFGIVMLKGRNAAQPVTDALAEHIEERFRLDFTARDAA
ncbi:LysR substrate-binding domain-containing protein [Acidisphaera sp. S103]|uniref:LysR substrate-binding domain-containing protein n=1 Tax=Acidisphaera sp. S103 TaxID=1747223 RepID=UPI00131E7A86|nr:LysR substrate-binding domain-containing protein [Acidisphaera sp. S103]